MTRFAVACLFVLLGTSIAAPAEARGGGRIDIGIGLGGGWCCGYYPYYAPYYYGYPAYYAPPTVVYEEQTAPVTYIQPQTVYAQPQQPAYAQPQQAYAQPQPPQQVPATQASEAFTDASGRTCRNFQSMINNAPVSGTACLQADGSWRTVGP